MARHEVRGGAQTLTLNADITSMSATCQANGTVAGFPTGAVNPFVVTIDSERILCASLAGSSPATITFAQRGYDGTTAAAHTANTDIIHGLAAVQIDDFFGHIYDDSRDDHSQYLDYDRHSAVSHTSGMYGGESVDNAALGTSAVDDRVLAPDSVGTSELKPDAVITENVGDDQITGAKIADGSLSVDHFTTGAVETDKIDDGAVTTPKLDDGAVTGDKQSVDLPRGYIGRGARTSMLTSLSSGGHPVTGCAVTFTAVANRRYKATASLRSEVGTAVANCVVDILDGLTLIARIGDHLAAPGGSVFRDNGDIDWVPGAGSTTVTLAVTFSANSNNQAGGGAGQEAFLRIEDIGGT